MFCWHAYNVLSTSLVVLSNQALPLADQQLTPSSLCDSCQSYIVNLTDHWTLNSWTLSLLSTPSVALPSGEHFAAKAFLTSYSIWSLPFMRTPVHVSGSDRNCRREFSPPTTGFMTHVTCRLTVKNRDQLRNPTLGNRVWATFTFYFLLVSERVAS